jgi:hypothetical protein
MNLDFEDKFRTIIMKMEKAGNEYAEAKGQSWQMQELRTSVLSKIMQAQGDLPVSKSEIIAKASEDYQSYVKETAEAIKKELRFKCEYEKWKSSFEALRSLSSLEKRTQELTG